MWMATNRDGTKTRAEAAPCDQARTGHFSSFASIAIKLCIGIVVPALALLPEYAAAGEEIAYLRPASSPSSAPQGAPNQSVTAVRVVAGHHRAYFGRERASHEARRTADWIVDSADNLGLPFVIVDKIEAKVFVFDAGGHIQGAAPALVGSARGDDTVPGIGDREYSDMPPETRTTPAGRFVAALGMDARGEDMLWVDYDAAVSLHRVVTTKPKERRLQRLATPTPLDNRISYGCINVPKRFYENVVSPAFTGTDGIVYVLPETRSTREVFGSYDVEERSRRTYADRTKTARKHSE
jgi:hypothetical protein